MQRPDVVERVSPWRLDPTPAGIGVFLGALNVLVIAVGFGASVGGGDPLSMMFIVALVGMVPGVLAGAFLGAIGGVLRRRSRAVRLAVLLVPALFVVCALATLFDLLQFAVVSFIPTTVAVLVLERLTREQAVSVVPMARTRRG